MNTPVNELKSSVGLIEQQLRADLESAYRAHKWFVLAGFVLGILCALVVHSV